MNVNTLAHLIFGADKNKTSTLIAAFQSTLLFFCVLFPLTFLHLFFYEGGHALADVYHGGQIDVLYAHPFALDGYARSNLSGNTILGDVAGHVLEKLVALVLFILFWKHRSVKTLPLVLLLPWSAMLSIFDVLSLANGTGDYYNFIRQSGIPAIYFYILNITLALAGTFFVVSLLPLLGIAPNQRRALFVLPAGILLWGLVGVTVAYLTVPGAPINIRYHLGNSLLASAKMYPIFGPILGLLLALIYITPYRWIENRLPAGLRTMPVTLIWKDLYLPACLAIACSLAGLALIT